MTAAGDSDEKISAYLVLFSTLLTIVLICSRLLHNHPRVAGWLPEAGMTVLLGMIFGALIHIFVDEKPNDEEDTVAKSLLSFSPQVFFIALLPPIIFNSGYHLKRTLFFRHFIPISLLAVLGTLVSAVSIAGILQVLKFLGLIGNFNPTFTELLTFGGLLSATDPVSTLAVFSARKVDPQLFYLVFGESVLNDAVGLVLFKSFARFVVRDNGAGKIAMGVGEFIIGFLLDAVGSPILGITCACGAALLFKHLDLRRNRLLELSIYVLIVYVPFLLAELAHLSGIVTILFTGMGAQAYVLPNLSLSTQVSSDVLFRLAAHLAETSIFLELGLSVFGLKGSYIWPFIGWTCVACLVARALHVYPLCFAFNKSLSLGQPILFSSILGHDDGIEPDGPATHMELANMSTTLDYRASEPDDRPPSIQRQDSNATSMSSSFRDLKISPSKQHMVWFSGLRGAVAYACVRSFPTTFGHARTFVVTTMMVVLVSVFILGGTTEIVLRRLGIDTDVDEESYLQEWDLAISRKSNARLEQLDSFLQRYLIRDNPDIMIHKEDADYYESERIQQKLHPEPEITQRNPTEVEERRKSLHKSLFDYGKGD